MKVIKEAFDMPTYTNDEVLAAVEEVKDKFDELRDALYVLDARYPEAKIDTLIYRLEDEFGTSMFGDIEYIESKLNPVEDESLDEGKIQDIGDGWYTEKEEVKEGLDGDKTEYDNGIKCPSCGKNAVFEIEDSQDANGKPIYQCQSCGAELVRKGLFKKFDKPTYYHEALVPDNINNIKEIVAKYPDCYYYEDENRIGCGDRKQWKELSKELGIDDSHVTDGMGVEESNIYLGESVNNRRFLNAK